MEAKEPPQLITIEAGTDLAQFSVDQLSAWLDAHEGPHDHTWVHTDAWQMWQAVHAFRSVLRVETEGGAKSKIQTAVLEKSPGGEYTIKQVRDRTPSV